MGLWWKVDQITDIYVSAAKPGRWAGWIKPRLGIRGKSIDDCLASPRYSESLFKWYEQRAEDLSKLIGVSCGSTSL
jgi:hypothetical protein